MEYIHNLKSLGWEFLETQHNPDLWVYGIPSISNTAQYFRLMESQILDYYGINLEKNSLFGAIVNLTIHIFYVFVNSTNCTRFRDFRKTVAASPSSVVLERFWAVQFFSYLSVESKTAKKI